MSPDPTLTASHRATLLELAATAIRVALETGRPVRPHVAALDPALARPAATFVTLERRTRLLGCIGSLEASRPLAVAVAEHALAAAFGDPRFSPITAADFAEMAITVSVLGPAEPIAAGSRAAVAPLVRAGTDGLVLDAPGRRSTLLPAVWSHVDAVDDFLDALWRKAGLPPDAWPPGTRVLRYMVEELADPGPRRPIGAPAFA